MWVPMAEILDDDCTPPTWVKAGPSDHGRAAVLINHGRHRTTSEGVCADNLRREPWPDPAAKEQT